MKNIIQNIFHYINEILYNNEFNDIESYKYFSILSSYNINNPKKILLHYCNLPNGPLWNKLINILGNKLILIKINLPPVFKNNTKNFFLKFKIILIYQILKKYGGVYLELNTISIKPITNFLKYNFFKSKNNEIIGSEIESYMTNKLIDFYYKNKDLSFFDEKFGIKNIDDKIINNHLIENLNFNNDEEYAFDIIFKEIYDYSFAEYFHLSKNCYFFYLNLKEDKLNNINVYYIFNKISIYNLLVRNSLIYNLINFPMIEDYTNYNQKLNLVNNLDIILWINLDNSIDRYKNMTNLLNNFKIENRKISAINGDIIDDIKHKYFFSENNIFPNYSNKEYAVLTSHLNTIEIFSKIDKKYLKYNIGLICEDDLSLDFIKYWNIDFKSIIENAPSNWEIIMLGYFSLDLNFTENYKKWDSEWSAISYLIKYDNLSEKLEKLKNGDKWICNQYDVMVSDNYIFSKFNTYVYKYPFFTFPNNNDSTFHEDHVDYHRIYKISNYIVHEKIYEEYI
jgi:hypothetical protein